MRSSIVKVLLGLVLVAAMAHGQGVVVDLTAKSNGTEIVVRWTTADEDGVREFVVLRSSEVDGQFLPIATVPTKGSYSTYDYVDRSVFKGAGSVFFYRIRVINGSATPPESKVVSTSHTSSTARRTWGSIKAMFR